MPYLFDALGGVQHLLSYSPFGLIVDIDGTISPIAPYPELATVTPACKRHLRSLSDLLPIVAAVSGRPAREARQLVGIPTMAYVGNHGLEWWEKGRVAHDLLAARFSPLVRRALRQLRSTVRESGVFFENKGTTAAIHYRQAIDHEAARESILEDATRVANSMGLRVMEGRMVVEIRPPIDVDKGTAVMKVIEKRGLKSALYFGDDTTDIDAFSALRLWRQNGEGDSLTVAVLNPESGDDLIGEADSYVDGVGDVERFLGWLAKLVSRQASIGPRAGDITTS